jgi:hypothetical protein
MPTAGEAFPGVRLPEAYRGSSSGAQEVNESERGQKRKTDKEE